MEFFFADDTFQKPSREGMGKLLGFGGVFVPEEVLGSLEQKINGICELYGFPKGEEIKWSPKRKSWIYQNLHGEDRAKCYSEILEATASFGCQALVVVCDTGRTTLKGEKAFKKVVEFTFERIEMHLAKIKKLGVIVADRPGGGHREDDQFLAEFLDRINEGTDYVVPEHVPINILTTPSHLQVADLVTGITCAMVGGQTKYAKQFFPIIKKMFISNSYGYIGGTGLKVFPDELINLYYWVLEETYFVKVAMNTGFLIPSQDLPYAKKEI